MDAIFLPPIYTDSVDSSEEEDACHLVEHFDLDLIENRHHHKLYQHLSKGIWPPFEELFILEPNVSQSPRLWILTTFLASLIILLSFSFKNDKKLISVRPVPTSINITLSPPQKVAEAPLSIAPSQEEVVERQMEPEKAFPQLLDKPQPVVEALTVNDIPEAVIETIGLNPLETELQSMIRGFVGEKVLEQAIEKINSDNSVTAYGTVFNPEVRNKLTSSLARKMNRWMPPQELLVAGNQERSYMVLGNNCYSITEDTSNSLSYAMGQNSGFVENIAMPTDCKNIYFQGRITRDDVGLQGQ